MTKNAMNRIEKCTYVSELTHYCEHKRDIVFEKECVNCNKFDNVDDTMLVKLKRIFKGK